MTVPRDDDVAILNEYFEAFNRKDVDTWVELFHPEITLVPTALWSPPGTTYHGRAGVRSYAHAAFGRFPDLRSELPELRDLDDRILGCGTVVSGPHPTTESARRIACLFTLRDGQISRIDAFLTEAEALAAARRTSTDPFGVLFQSASDAAILTDDHATVVDGNTAAATLCGLRLEVLRRRTLLELVAPESVRRVTELWSELRTRGRCFGEVEMLSPSGEREQLVLRATANFIPGRHVVVLSPAPLADGDELRASGPRLTDREQEVFRLLALGFTVAEVAERLFLSPHTVRRHVEKGIARLEAKNRLHAVTIALESGQIEL